jgi:hypothetical protein
MKVLQIFDSFQRGIWPLNMSIVLPFIIKMMICFNGFALFINIIWIFLIAFNRLDVGIAFGGQDPPK